ncbi:MAG: hypothetical protein J2P57_11050, partial [Acidimicrobiaceae bacterium]|nr:hypothetical protein [Acidimicrobiaceae bacterium]
MASETRHRSTDLPIEPLTRWLDDQGVRLDRPVTATLISGGRSNLTYALTAGDGRRVVLRRP